ncbi:GntR family transcriptional regulator [Rhodococcoides trifolii]|uniref:GntR family transcriptional regulator n=2 Tax=Rhodococcoides trifolii TaxID=908250 RepID=A0A917CYD1_9NOCA|nr:GntR family transcriptional regulator [Rhodococcus trifolii]
MLGNDLRENGTAPAQSVLGQLPPRDTTLLVRNVRDRLRLAITLGEIPAGSRLNQVKLAKQLGVSRMPVRSAITELVAEGLLELVAGGGVDVRILTAKDVKDAYEIRLALETRAVRHIAENQPTWGLGKIEQLVATHQPLVATYGEAELLAADRDFHMTILDSTDNPYMRRAILPVWSTVERAMVQVLHFDGVFRDAWDEHFGITEAMRAGNADLAEKRMRKHLGTAMEELSSRLS